MRPLRRLDRHKKIVLAAVVIAGVVGVAVILGVFAFDNNSESAPSGCPGPTNQATAPAPLPKPAPGATRLVAERYPSRLDGSIVLSVGRTHGDVLEPTGLRQSYSIKLDDVSLKLVRVSGKGANQQATYVLTGTPRASFSGYEDSTDAKGKSSRVVWRGDPQQPVKGELLIGSTRFSSPASYDFVVPEIGTKRQGPCGSDSVQATTLKRALHIPGHGTVLLTRTGTAEDRFKVGIEVYSVTKGSVDTGGYTIGGSFAPPVGSRPVPICRATSAGLDCPAG